jgi:hypothetical protein
MRKHIIEMTIGLVFALAIIAAQYATTSTTATFVYQQF